MIVGKELKIRPIEFTPFPLENVEAVYDKSERRLKYYHEGINECGRGKEFRPIEFAPFPLENVVAVCDKSERRQNYYREGINEYGRGNRRNYNRHHCDNENNKDSQNNLSLYESNI